MRNRAGPASWCLRKRKRQQSIWTCGSFTCSRNKFYMNQVWSFYCKQHVVLILPALYKYGAWFVCDTSDLSLNHIPSRGMEFLPHNHRPWFERPPSLHDTSNSPYWCHKCFCSSLCRTPCNNFISMSTRRKSRETICFQIQLHKTHLVVLSVLVFPVCFPSSISLRRTMNSAIHLDTPPYPLISWPKGWVCSMTRYDYVVTQSQVLSKFGECSILLHVKSDNGSRL